VAQAQLELAQAQLELAQTQDQTSQAQVATDARFADATGQLDSLMTLVQRDEVRANAVLVARAPVALQSGLASAVAYAANPSARLDELSADMLALGGDIDNSSVSFVDLTATNASFGTLLVGGLPVALVEQLDPIVGRLDGAEASIALLTTDLAANLANLQISDDQVADPVSAASVSAASMSANSINADVLEAPVITQLLSGVQSLGADVADALAPASAVASTDSNVAALPTGLAAVDVRADALKAADISLNLRLGQVEIRVDQAETRSDQADTQLEQTGARLDQAETSLDQADARLDQANARLGQGATGLDQADARLD
jgi:hypothetical protein